MRREDLTVPALFLEAIGMIFAIVYIGLQIYYGVCFHISPLNLVLNLLVMILVYVGLSLLSSYPERLNRLPVEVCRGNVRKYSIRMIRLVKFVFVTGLLIPCVFDALGIEIMKVYSLIVVGVILVIAVFYEYNIIKELKNMN